ncbi:MAG TPA: thiamine-phosphate kinase, partial [Acidobacteriaceae bacterium]
AMGAKPLACFLSLALPGDIPATRKGREWIGGFFTGFNALTARYGVPLAGGDTSESPSPHILADIVLLGSAPAGRALRRSTARAGDVLYVTGQLGGSAAELAMLQKRGKLSPARHAPSGSNTNPHPHLYPQPRLALGQSLLRRKLATACIDLSDGLSTDLKHLCEESNLGAEIEASALPIHPLAFGTAIDGRSRNKGRDPLSLGLHGGEDYELLFAASPSAHIPQSICGVPVTRIGILKRGKSISLIDGNGRSSRLPARGWEHFAGKG